MRTKKLKDYGKLQEDALRWSRIYKNLKANELEETKRHARLYALNSNMEKVCNNIAKLMEICEDYDWRKNNKDLEKYL